MLNNVKFSDPFLEQHVTPNAKRVGLLKFDTGCTAVALAKSVSPLFSQK